MVFFNERDNPAIHDYLKTGRFVNRSGVIRLQSGKSLALVPCKKEACPQNRANIPIVSIGMSGEAWQDVSIRDKILFFFRKIPCLVIPLF
jgi:hypothetical protein